MAAIKKQSDIKVGAIVASDGLAPGLAEAELYDQRHMDRIGNKQEFEVSASCMIAYGTLMLLDQRNYGLFSITAFSAVAMSGWVFVPNNSFGGLTDGNSGSTIVMYLVNFFEFSSTTLSLAEISSMAPTAGGQYHWA